jgi:hypothetical protein
MIRLILIVFGLTSLIACEEKVIETQNYRLTPFDPSIVFENAAIDGYQYQNNQFVFQISNYILGEQTEDAELKMCANSKDGQHLHIIVDSLPYEAKYTTEFEHIIKDGEHYLLSFLSRSYHESIKEAKSFSADKVKIEAGSIIESIKVEDPMMFYSRPKGNYVGKKETEKVMLDFFLVNHEKLNGFKILADINGEVHEISEWQPYYIEGLPIGENIITLSLVDLNGNLIQTPLNPVTRKFNLVEDPAEKL